MKPDSWYGSRHALLISSVLVPPVGLVLLWVRSGTGAFRKIFGTVPILLLGIFYFHLIFGIHVEFEGSASRRRLIVSLHNPERHYAAIERDRAEQKAKAMELAASSVKKEPSRKIAALSPLLRWKPRMPRGQRFPLNLKRRPTGPAFAGRTVTASIVKWRF